MDMHQVRIYWSTILMTPLLSCLRSFPHLQYITLVLALCLAKLPSSGHTAFLWQHHLPLATPPSSGNTAFLWPPTIEQVSWCSVENLLIFSTSVWSHHNYAPKGTFLCSHQPKPHTWCYYYYYLTWSLLSGSVSLSSTSIILTFLHQSGLITVHTSISMMWIFYNTSTSLVLQH